jgi:hypothetical protein
VVLAAPGHGGKLLAPILSLIDPKLDVTMIIENRSGPACPKPEGFGFHIR